MANPNLLARPHDLVSPATLLQATGHHDVPVKARAEPCDLTARWALANVARLFQHELVCLGGPAMQRTRC